MGGDEMRNIGTIEKDNGSPFGLSPKDAYSSTPNIKVRDTLERPTTDRGLVMFRNTTEVDEAHGYYESGNKADREIAPIEIDDEDD